MTAIRRKSKSLGAAAAGASEAPEAQRLLAPARLRLRWLSARVLLWTAATAAMLAAVLVFVLEPAGETPDNAKPAIADAPPLKGPRPQEA